MENCYASARQAGEAFKHRVESDKDLQSRLNRWSERLAKIGEALHEANPEMERIRAEWRHDFGADLPENLDDLVRLATRAGVGFERIRAARPDDLMPVIEGYLQRLSDQREQRTAAGEASGLEVAASSTPDKKPASKTSTPHGGTDPLILTALIAHHGYNQGSTQCRDPIAGRALAKKANVAIGSVSSFWKKRLRNKDRAGTHSDYCTACSSGKIDFYLSFWNGDVAPAEALQAYEDSLDQKV